MVTISGTSPQSSYLAGCRVDGGRVRGQDHGEVPQRVPGGGPLEVHPALVQTCRIQHISTHYSVSAADSGLLTPTTDQRPPPVCTPPDLGAAAAAWLNTIKPGTHTVKTLIPALTGNLLSLYIYLISIDICFAT